VSRKREKKSGAAERRVFERSASVTEQEVTQLIYLVPVSVVYRIVSEVSIERKYIHVRLSYGARGN
jgi:hypothetical protein